MLILLAAVYGRVVSFDFVGWDDAQHLAENPLLRTPSWGVIARYFTAPFFDLYIPVTYTFWSGIAWASQWLRADGVLASSVFHAANLLTHAFNTLLVYALARRIFPAVGACAAGAMLFALHPLAVEPVAWISSARDLWSTTFSLLALYQIMADTSKRWWPRAAGFLLFFFAAFLAKPAAASLPLVAALLVLAHGPRVLSRRNLCWLGFSALLVSPLIAWTFHLQDDPSSFVPPSFWQRPFVAAHALCFYAAKFFFPYPLLADYGLSPSVVLASKWWFMAPLWLLLPLFFAWRWPLSGKRAMWYAALSLAALSPVLGIIPFNYQRISTVADRYFYLAMLGPALMLSALLSRMRSRLWYAGAALVLALLAGVSYFQLDHWRDTKALFSHTLLHNPKSVVALNNLGLLAMAGGDFSTAESLLRQAQKVDPAAYQVSENLGVALAHLGRIDEAIAQHRHSIATMPQLALAHVNLAQLLHQRAEDDAALEHDREAVRLDPTHYLARNNLGALLCDKGLFAAAREQLEAAVPLSRTPALAYFNLALVAESSGAKEQVVPALDAALQATFGMVEAERAPLQSRIHNSLALYFLHQGDQDRASEHIAKALAADGVNPQIHYNAGLIDLARGRRDEARRQMRSALALDPRLADAKGDLAVMDWEEGGGESALKDLGDALVLAPQNARLHCNMGALLLAKGAIQAARAQFDAAQHLDPHASCPPSQVK